MYLRTRTYLTGQVMTAVDQHMVVYIYSQGISEEYEFQAIRFLFRRCGQFINSFDSFLIYSNRIIQRKSGQNIQSLCLSTLYCIHPPHPAACVKWPSIWRNTLTPPRSSIDFTLFIETAVMFYFGIMRYK